MISCFSVRSMAGCSRAVFAKSSSSPYLLRLYASRSLGEKSQRSTTRTPGILPASTRCMKCQLLRSSCWAASCVVNIPLRCCRLRCNSSLLSAMVDAFLRIAVLHCRLSHGKYTIGGGGTQGWVIRTGERYCVCNIALDASLAGANHPPDKDAVWGTGYLSQRGYLAWGAGNAPTF